MYVDFERRQNIDSGTESFEQKDKSTDLMYIVGQKTHTILLAYLGFGPQKQRYSYMPILREEHNMYTPRYHFEPENSAMTLEMLSTWSPAIDVRTFNFEEREQRNQT